MKKNGFTLAETVLTLAIIGVVAAMTIPGFTAGAKNQSNASKLSSIVSDYENVFGMMLLKENCDKLSDTAFASKTSSSDIETELNKYTKIVSVSTTKSGLGYTAYAPLLPLGLPVMAKGGNEGGGGNSSATNFTFDNIKTGTSTFTVNYGIVLPNGAIILMCPKPSGSSNDMWRQVLIDTNGASVPNRLGRDIFTFALGQDGHLYPYGSEAVKTLAGISKTWKDNDVTYGCNTNNYSGIGCTARLVEHNYKVDY